MRKTQVKKPYFWSNALKVAMEDPKQVIDSDDKIVIIKDGYPKAKYHFLILPKENIKDLQSVRKEHLPLLKHMDKVAHELTERLASGTRFRYGYHANPSMSHLHLHVISQDLHSPCLKHKKHWNSFTTAFFIDSNEIIDQLENKGKLHIMSKAEADKLLKLPLKCHLCKKEFPVFPKLKEHVRLHASDKDSGN